MKRLTAHLYTFLLAPLRYLSGALALLMFTAIAAAQQINPYSNNVFAFFSDPAMFALAVSGVSGWLTELVTDALKDQNFKLRGWHTRLLAGGVAAILAGGGGFFGLSYFTGTSGWAGAGTAAGMALGAWLFADVKHRAGSLRRAGARKAVREGEVLPGVPVEEVEEVVDPILTSLLKEAAKLPPPFGIAASIVTTVYETFGAAAVLKLIRTQRALSEAEKSEDQDSWEREQASNPTVRPARPSPQSAPHPSLSE